MQPEPYEQLTDTELMALCLYREARGESYLGKRAVAHVILNRSKAWHQTIHKVILGKNQFTSFSIGDPNETVWPADEDADWKDCWEISEATINGTDNDITDGALYYYNPALTKPDSWFVRNIADNEEDHPFKVSIGNHHYFA